MQVWHKMHQTRGMCSNQHKMHWLQGGSQEWSQDATISPAQDARAWEEAARPQGLFPSYPRRSGREARDLHDKPTAWYLRRERKERGKGKRYK